MTLFVYLLLVVFVSLIVRATLRDIRADVSRARLNRRPPEPKVPVLDATRYPNGVLKPDFFDPAELTVHVKDWRHVRELEWNLDNRFYHTVDGESIPAGDPRATEKEQTVRTPLEPYRDSVEYVRAPGSLRKCMHCGTTENLWQSSVDDNWRCHKAECQPCWCGYCHGRVGVHGDEAKRLYAAQAEAARVYRDPPPWGAEMDRMLRAEGLDAPTEGLLEWNYSTDLENRLTMFSARYADGTSYKVQRLGEYWHVSSYAAPRTGGTRHPLVRATSLPELWCDNVIQAMTNRGIF